MYRKRIFIGLLIGWLAVLALSVYSISLRNEAVISGAAVRALNPLSDSYSVAILIFSAIVLVLVAVYFTVQNK